MQTWIRLVEATGGEIGVTLLVSGTVVSGVLTPWARYAAWTKEVMMRGMHEGGKQALPSISMGPIPPALTAEVRDSWTADAEASGNPDEYEPEFPQFALRDATIISGLRPFPVTLPYLVIDANRVDALAPVQQGGA